MEWRTRIVDDACIFLNRDGFPAGPGCALHLHAMRTGAPPRRAQARGLLAGPAAPPRRRAGRRHRRSRRSPSSAATGWGEGGEDFAWWCTEEPEAFVGKVPVYVSMADELRMMLGKRLYRDVVAYLDACRRSDGPAVAHPAAVPVQLTKKRKARPKSR